MSLPRLDSPLPVAASASPRALAAYRLYRRLRRVLVTLDGERGVEALATALLEALVPDDADAPLVAGRAYRRGDGGFELFAQRGPGEAPLGYLVPANYPLLDEALRDGWALAHASDLRFDAELERPFPGRTYAFLALGEGTELLLAFTAREPVGDELADVLPTLRSIAEVALRQRELVQHFTEARAVQTSLLPLAAPRFPGFDVAFRSRPAKLVGGDLFDFRIPQPGTLALAIGDATGHGLPAALQARDAVIGMRMVWAQQLKLARGFEELARVLREGSSGRRFISLFAAELDAHGHLVYANAGHPPPLRLGAGGAVEELVATGQVMGLAAAPAYGRAFTALAPGEVLILYTDGMVEARGAGGDEAGVERLVTWVRAAGEAPAAAAVEATFAALDAFTAGAPQIDDQTLIVVRRLPASR